MSYQWLHHIVIPVLFPFWKIPRFKGGWVHLIPDSLFLVFNTVRMYQRCSEAHGGCQTHVSVSYLGETWQKKWSFLSQPNWTSCASRDKMNETSNQSLWQNRTGGINLHVDWNSSVGMMNQVQPEILLAVQLGALHARSYWTLQCGVKETHHTCTRWCQRLKCCEV